LREQAEARLFVLKRMWRQRVLPVRAANVPAILDLAFAAAAEGEPLPLPGFLADVAHLVFQAATGVAGETVFLPQWSGGPARAYEDQVLGKLLADAAFERAGDALRQYPAADRSRGLAFLVQQMRQRVGFPGVLLSPAVIKTLRDLPAQQLLAEGWESLHSDGPTPLLTQLHEGLVAAMRGAAELIGPEDVFELERRTALAPFSQRLALRQVLQTAAQLSAELPARKPRTVARRWEVPTNLMEEDTYPVGGFTSISTRGSVESLLHSQLAMMEPDDRPDLFDIKFLRDELLYYSRDENQFLRRRRSFVFTLWPDLVQTRFRDGDLPVQRIVMVLASLVSAVRKTIDWLGDDALQFVFFFVTEDGESPLDEERKLLELVLSEQIANGTVAVETGDAVTWKARCTALGKRSQCHALMASTQERRFDVEHVATSRLAAEEASWHGWSQMLETLLAGWV
jgi:hypothetical protein